MKLTLTVFFFSFMTLVLSCNTNDGKEEKQSVAISEPPSDSLSYFLKLYYNRRDSIITKRYGAQMVRIDTAYGNAYIEAYLREAVKDKTEGVILDLPTIALFYDYLRRNPGMKIGVSLARYSKKYWQIGRNVFDPIFDSRLTPSDYNRLAFVFGAYDSRNGFQPFIEANGDKFYEDWNQEWP